MTQRALILDGHIGCQLWQRAVLQKLGVKTRVLSLRSKHARQQIDQPPLPSVEQKALNAIKFLWWRRPKRRSWNAVDGKLLSLLCGKRRLAALFDEADFLLGAYPPNVGRLLLDLAHRHQKGVILNLANRFSQENTSRRDAASFVAVLKEIHQSPEHTLAVMGEYDFQYVRHHLGIEPVKLYTSCHHIPLRDHRPVYQTVLLDAPPP